jgi:hypothetical protein
VKHIQYQYHDRVVPLDAVVRVAAKEIAAVVADAKAIGAGTVNFETADLAIFDTGFCFITVLSCQPS